MIEKCLKLDKKMILKNFTSDGLSRIQQEIEAIIENIQ